MVGGLSIRTDRSMSVSDVASRLGTPVAAGRIQHSDTTASEMDVNATSDSLKSPKHHRAIRLTPLTLAVDARQCDVVDVLLK